MMKKTTQQLIEMGFEVFTQKLPDGDYEVDIRKNGIQGIGYGSNTGEARKEALKDHARILSRHS